MTYIKLLLRSIIVPIIHYLGLVRICTSFSQPRYLILNYHGVVKKLKLNLSRNHLSVKQFEEHLNYFKKHFDVISLESLIDRKRQGIRPKRNTIAITFDDGYENNFLNAYPLLNRYKFPATIFVTAQAIAEPGKLLWYDSLDLCKNALDWESFKKSNQYNLFNTDRLGNNAINSFEAFKQMMKDLDQNQKNEVFKVLLPERVRKIEIDSIDPEYWKLLSNEQIREMTDSNLIEIGSHGITHSNLDILNDQLLQEELEDSKKMLESVTKKTVNSIAFPDGAYNMKVKQYCRKNQYKNLFSVKYRCAEDKSEHDIFERFSISNTTIFESVMIQIHLAFKKNGF